MSNLTGKYITRSTATTNWTYRFTTNGQTFKGTCGTTDKRAAEAFALEKVKAARALEETERRLGNAPMTFGLACDKWLAGKAPKLREQFLENQVAWLRKQIGENKLLQDIRKGDLTDMVAAREQCLRPDKGGGWRKVAPATVNKTVRLLQRILGYAHRNHDATVKEFAWKDFVVKIGSRPARRAFTETVEQQIFGLLDVRYLELTRFAMISGLRAQENLLLWEQIDWQTAVIRDVTGKGHRDGRDVPLGDDEMALLQAEYNRPDRHPTHVWSYAAERTRIVGRTDRLVVKGSRYPITYAGWNSAWDRMKAAAGLEVRIHDLRHTAVTRALQRTGGNVAAVRDMVGHSDVKITMAYWSGDEAAVRGAKSIGLKPAIAPNPAPRQKKYL